MASKIKSHTFYVAIAPYKAGANEETFNDLSVMTAFDDVHKYFYVSLHAGWNTGWGGHGCIFLGPDDPLTAPKYVKVKDSPKNSQKTINEIGASLEQAKDAIAWLFDHREWAKLYLAVGDIARNGYTEQIRKQIEALINSNNNQNKEDENMRLNINNNSETKNVQNNAQVTNNETIVSQVDVIGLMNGLKKNGTAKLSDYATPVVPDAAPVEDAHAEEIESVNVGEVTVESIMPVMQPVEVVAEEPKTEKPAVTMPMGSHGTLVIAGVGSDKPKPEMPKRDKNGKFLKKSSTKDTKDTKSVDSTKPDPEAVGELAGMLTKAASKREQNGTRSDSAEREQARPLVKVSLVVYKTKKGADAPMIVGFSGEDDERWKKLHDAKPKWVSAGCRKNDEGTKQYHLMFGSRYMAVAKALCEAYNTIDKAAWDKAEQACAGCYDGIVSGFKAEKEARKAERAAAREAAQPAAKTYTNEDVAAMLRKVLAGGSVPEEIAELLKAA